MYIDNESSPFTYNKWNRIEYMVDKLVVLTIYYLQNSSIPETQIIHVNYIICCENLFSNQLGI